MCRRVATPIMISRRRRAAATILKNSWHRKRGCVSGKSRRWEHRAKVEADQAHVDARQVESCAAVRMAVVETAVYPRQAAV